MTAPGRRWTDVEAMLGHLEKLRSRAGEAMGRYAEAREEAGDLTSEGFSDDGSVRVVVDDGGQVTKVEIPDSAMSRPTWIGRAVVTAIHQAQAAHALKMADLTSRMGGGIDVSGMVRDAIPPEVSGAMERRDERRY